MYSWQNSFIVKEEKAGKVATIKRIDYSIFELEVEGSPDDQATILALDKRIS